jgi:hypothetical protein
MKSFLSRFGSFILFVLSGFDRLRFRGESRLLNHALGVNSYLIQRRILLKDFAEHAQALTETLRLQTLASAKKLDVPVLHLNSPDQDKEAAALQLARRHHKTQGRIALLTCVEGCRSYRIRKNTAGLIEVRKEPSKCLHYYHYFQHPRVGLCYVRLQTWFPFIIHIGLNGREWLVQQLQRCGQTFKRRDNLLLAVADPHQAQRLLDEQRHTDWPTLLDDLVRPIHPLWSYLNETARTPYHWMTEQSEWATDFVFRSPRALASWYPRWLRHGLETLQCQDVLRYFGKKVPARCCGDKVTINLATRAEGARLKFWHNTNSLKFYDKAANAFRIETTINQPKDFRVWRTSERQPDDAPKAWLEMRKGVADLDRRAEVSQAANNRLADSLASIADTTPLGKLLEPLGRPVFEKGRRRARPLNPLTGADGTLLRCLAQGQFLLNGFRNRDLRFALHGETADHDQRRRQSAAITRQLALLRCHGLIVKVPKTHRYLLSAAGKHITTALLAAHASDVNRLATPA